MSSAEYISHTPRPERRTDALLTRPFPLMAAHKIAALRKVRAATVYALNAGFIGVIRRLKSDK